MHLILVNMIPSLQLGHEFVTIAGVLYVFIPWVLAHWEEYHTGVMLYGNGLWGVTEINYAAAIMHFHTYLTGPEWWTWCPLVGLMAATGVDKALPAPVAAAVAGLQANHLFMLAFGVLSVHMAIFEQLPRVLRLAGSQLVHSTTLPPAEQGNKTLGKGAAAWHLVQIGATCATGGLLLVLPLVPPSQVRVLYATFGVVYALQATRLIMAHMTKEPFSVAAWPLAMMGLQIGNNFVPTVDPLLLAYAVNAVVVAGYLHYVISIVGEICAYLGINALTIKLHSE